MDTWMWIVIAAAVVLVVLLAICVGCVAQEAYERTYSEGFGPEYDRTVEEAGSRRKAESELTDREKRREELDIRPLASAGPRPLRRSLEQACRSGSWTTRASALRDAHVLVVEVMRERGYPTDDFEQRAADVSVDHPHVVENYRSAHAITERSDADTEEQRQAMVHYRALFDELAGDRDRAGEQVGAGLQSAAAARGRGLKFSAGAATAGRLRLRRSRRPRPVRRART